MQFFVDSADINDIRNINALGLCDGVTTNPSLILKSKRNITQVISEICAEITGPVSAEVVATDFDGMMKEAQQLTKIASNICIKLPLTLDGIKACKALTAEGYQTNMTLCFSVIQALLAAKAGATYVSPFIGRLDDVGENGSLLIKEITTTFTNYGYQTKVLAASIRNIKHIRACLMHKADVITIPPNLFEQLIHHPLTDKGLAIFADDWAKTGQSIG